MSIYNTLHDNEINLRANKVMASELYTRDGAGEYFRVTPSSGGGDLPNYLKPNHIQIGSPEVYTVLDSDSVDVNGGTVGNAIGTSLRADSLIFGDNSGNSSFTKADIDALKYIQTGTMVSTKNETLGNYLVLYNPTTKNLCRANTFTLGNSLVGVYASMYEISVQSSASKYLRMTGGSGFQAIDGILNSQLSPDRISFGNASGYKSLNRDDIIVTNNLKSLTSKTIDSGSKMMLYDSTTKAFNFTDIPAGSTLPYYLYTNSIGFENIDTGSKLSLDGFSGEITSSALTDTSFVKINGKWGAIDIKNSTGTNTMYREDIAVTNNLKALAVGTNTKVVTYNPTTKIFNMENKPTYAVKYQITSSLNGIFPSVSDTWSPLNPTSMLKTFDLTNSNILYLETTGAFIAYDTWYALKVNAGANYVVKMSIVQHKNNGYSTPNAEKQGRDKYNICEVIYAKNANTLTNGAYVIPAGSLLFQLVNSNTTMLSGHYFDGIIKIEMLSNNTSSIPTITPT